MDTIIERDEVQCGNDPEYPVVLSVHVGQTQSMEFHFTYRLRIEGGQSSKLVVGVCDFEEMRSPGALDEDVGEYVAQGFTRSAPEVRRYLQDQFPHAKITGRIRSRFKSAYQPPEFEL